MKHTLRRGTTVSEQQQIIHENSISIEAIAELIDMGMDDFQTNETVSHALTLIQRLSNEIHSNNASIVGLLQRMGVEDE